MLCAASMSSVGSERVLFCRGDKLVEVTFLLLHLFLWFDDLGEGGDRRGEEGGHTRTHTPLRLVVSTVSGAAMIYLGIHSGT